MKLTQDKINSLPSPKGRTSKGKYLPGEAIYADAGKGAASGLALRLREGGSRKFLISWMQGKKRRRMTIGDASVMSLEEARRKARKLLVKVDDGADPHLEKATKRKDDSQVFLARATEYLTARSRDMKQRSLEESRRHLLTHWKALHRLPLAKIDGDVIAEELEVITSRSGPVAANRARSTLSAFFGWAISTSPRFKGANPVIGTKREKEESREKVLTDVTLAAIWNAAPDTDYGRIVKLLMLTACRRNEIGALQPSEIALGDSLIAIPGERTKNGKEHKVPLSNAALAILSEARQLVGREYVFGEGEGGFSGWSRAKASLDAKAGVSDWTLHDLRRTAATGMAELGVFPHVLEGVLNHISGHKKGVAGIYNRASYETQKREALDLWATRLATIVAQASGANVTALKPRKRRGTRQTD